MQAEIARLRELLAKATPGEFALHKRSPTTIIASDGYSATNTDSNLFDANVRNEANAAALVAAINFLRSNDFALLALAEAVSEDRKDAERWAFYVHAMTAEDGTSRMAIQRQAFPAHTKEAWDACIDKAMSEVVLPGAAND